MGNQLAARDDAARWDQFASLLRPPCQGGVGGVCRQHVMLSIEQLQSLRCDRHRRRLLSALQSLPTMFLPAFLHRCRVPAFRSGVTWVLALGVLVGQVGLPNFSLPSANGEAAAESHSSCSCGWWARAWGRCCCRAKTLANRGGCCSRSVTKKTAASGGCCASKTNENCVADPPVTRRGLRPEKAEQITLRERCRCDDGLTVALLRCADPRVIADVPNVSSQEHLVAFLAMSSEQAPGERARPAVPPPKSCAVSVCWV
jgi:hypothetical protein